MVLAQNKEFWQLMDRAHKEGEKKGLPNSELCLTRSPLTKSFAERPHFTRARRSRFWRPRREGRDQIDGEWNATGPAG